MTREEAIDIIKCLAWHTRPNEEDVEQAIKALEQEQEPKISLDTYKQVTKERDIAIEQLHELGYEFGEKIEPTTKNDLGVDYISRVKVIDYLCKHCPDDGECFKDCDDIKHLRKMPSITPQLSVPEVTALAEWTAKLTKASEDAYNKGYADGMKAQEPRKGHWITRPHVYGVTYCSECDFELKTDDTNYCPNCGAKMVEPQESEDT